MPSGRFPVSGPNVDNKVCIRQFFLFLQFPGTCHCPVYQVLSRVNPHLLSQIHPRGNSPHSGCPQKTFLCMVRDHKSNLIYVACQQNLKAAVRIQYAGHIAVYLTPNLIRKALHISCCCFLDICFPARYSLAGEQPVKKFLVHNFPPSEHVLDYIFFQFWDE